MAQRTQERSVRARSRRRRCPLVPSPCSRSSLTRYRDGRACVRGREGKTMQIEAFESELHVVSPMLLRITPSSLHAARKEGGDNPSAHFRTSYACLPSAHAPAAHPPLWYPHAHLQHLSGASHTAPMHLHLSSLGEERVGGSQWGSGARDPLPALTSTPRRVLVDIPIPQHHATYIAHRHPFRRAQPHISTTSACPSPRPHRQLHRPVPMIASSSHSLHEAIDLPAPNRASSLFVSTLRTSTRCLSSRLSSTCIVHTTPRTHHRALSSNGRWRLRVRSQRPIARSTHSTPPSTLCARARVAPHVSLRSSDGSILVLASRRAHAEETFARNHGDDFESTTLCIPAPYRKEKKRSGKMRDFYLITAQWKHAARSKSA
ncbi:hypothetical protein K438DRAFT_2030136 [Mycena galopus ATCC 62051]|nr:hypothetical protein K438DRAFT_2030136 [Mycena galopus ATCC 62051]